MNTKERILVDVVQNGAGWDAAGVAERSGVCWAVSGRLSRQEALNDLQREIRNTHPAYLHAEPIPLVVVSDQETQNRPLSTMAEGSGSASRTVPHLCGVR